MSDYQTRRSYNQQGRDYDHRGGPRDRGGPGGPGGQRRGMPLSELDPALTELSRRVIGCAIEVHKELGPGYPAHIYMNAFSLEMGDEEIPHARDRVFKVYYGEEDEENLVGEITTDFFIGDRFLVRVLAESKEIGGQERSELRAQLRAADLELGLIINFGERRLKDGLVRVLNPDKLNRGEDDGEEYEGDEEE